MNRSQLVTMLADRIHRTKRSHPTRVAIDGPDTAGKTTLAEELVGPLCERGRSVIRASIDGFHHPREVRHRRGPESPRGYYQDSFDLDAMCSVLLDPLGPHGDLAYRTVVFDFRKDAKVESPVEWAKPESVLLFDGVFLFRSELRDHWDFKIFVDVSFETVLERAVLRDTGLFGSEEAVRERYEARYVPGQRLYFAECRPKKLADVIVRNDDPEDARLETGS